MTDRRTRASRSSAVAFLELFALNGFVVVQPLLDAMGRSPELFVLRRASGFDIVLLTLSLVVVPPLVLWTVERLLPVPFLHRLFVTGLLVLVAVQIGKDLTGWRGEALAVAALAAGIALSVAVARIEAMRTWLRYLAVAPVAFALLFLLVSPVSRLVVGGDAAGATGLMVDSDGPPVVMVVFDELPLMSLLDDDGRIHAGLYPNFARLAATSTWLRNTTTVNSYTSQAVPAMLTGRLPHGRAPVAIDNPSSLFTLLGGGYDVVAYEAVTALCPASVCEQGAPVGPTGPGALLSDALHAWGDVIALDEDDGDVTESIFDASDDERSARREAAAETARTAMKASQPARFTAFVDDLDGDRDETFWFLHLLMPHTPWRYLPSGMQYEHRPFGKDGDLWIDEPWVTRHHQQRHLLQLAYTDRLLGEVLDRMEAEGMFDEALLVVTADHGAGFTAGAPFRKLEEENTAELAWVPLFVKVPDQTEGEVRDDNVMIVDILPTVADALGVDLPWEIDGISVFGPPRATTQKRYASAGDKIVDAARWFPEVLRGTLATIGLDARTPDDLFLVGPHPELLGQTVPPGEATEGSATVDDVGAFTDVQPGRGTVPALVTGSLQHDRPPAAVAVALNGTVVATSEVYGDDPARFAAVLPDAAFVAGANRLEVLAIGPDGALTRLRVRG